MGSEPAAVATLIDAFELVRLLDLVRDHCSSERGWPWVTVMLPVRLPGQRPSLHRIGSGVPRWRWQEVDGDGGGTLLGLEAREVLARAWGSAPALELDLPVWQLRENTDLPLSRRLGPLRDPARIADVREAVTAALATLASERDALAARAIERADAAAWERCGICSPLGGRTFEWYLPIVGAPHFHDAAARDWCVKRCPRCATCYLHQSDYEYLVNGGTEDEVTVTRLSPDEEAGWLARVDAIVRERERG